MSLPIKLNTKSIPDIVQIRFYKTLIDTVMNIEKIESLKVLCKKFKSYHQIKKIKSNLLEKVYRYFKNVPSKVYDQAKKLHGLKYNMKKQ